MTGRVDDIINVAGHRLSTMEMESAIMEGGGVAEVAVVGMPDAIKGTVPAAFVTLRAGESASAEMKQMIRLRVSDAISKIAVPEHVIFTDVMPKTPSGKIMRRLLKEIVSSGEVGSDVTALEDVTSVEKLKALVLDALGSYVALQVVAPRLETRRRARSGASRQTSAGAGLTTPHYRLPAASATCSTPHGSRPGGDSCGARRDPRA